MKPKFRVWHKDGKVMLSNYLGFMITDAGQLLIESILGDEMTMEKVEPDNYIVMQGWKPEYQPELTIYEGDIINVHWFYANHDPETLGVYEDETNLKCVEVIEVRGVLGFYFEDDFLPLAFVPTHEESFEVIGNIYENQNYWRKKNETLLR